jgi:hypothetical protein
VTEQAQAQAAPARPVAGYTLVLPPGWFRVPVRHGSAKAIRGAVAESLRALPSTVPRDRVPPYRAQLEGRLRTLVTQARSRGGVDLYLPVTPMHGIPVSASFIVSEGTVGDLGQEVDPVQVVAYLATEAATGATEGPAGSTKATPVTVDGTAAVRREHMAPPEPGTEIEAGSRRVDYIIPLPGDAGRWLLVAFSTPGAGDPSDRFAGMLAELFDAIMSTFRWTRT